MISDASTYAAEADFPSKANLLALLMRAQDLSWYALHRHLYARYTGREQYLDGRVDQGIVRDQVDRVDYAQLLGPLGEQDPRQFLSVVVPMTARWADETLRRQYSSCTYNDKGDTLATIHRTVAGYGTLKELKPGEVVKAYWLGYVMGTIYWPAIDCARELARTGGDGCPQAAQSSDPLVCPKRDVVLARLRAAR